MSAGAEFLPYKRSRFSTQLPVAYRYSPSHYWMAQHEPGSWRVGLTKFATRMLGEMVEFNFETESGSRVEAGQILGWIEGFKAISDVFCIARGEFAGSNPVLKDKITAINKDPYGSGWLYAVRGEPDGKCMDVRAYSQLLDKTIDKILEKQHSS